MSRAFFSTLLATTILTGCWRNEGERPYLPDARRALAANEPSRARGAARVVLDYAETIESTDQQKTEANSIIEKANRIIADARLAEARTQPLTQEGLQRRRELLQPVLTEVRLAEAHVVLGDGVLPLWQKVEPLLDARTYQRAIQLVEHEYGRNTGALARALDAVDQMYRKERIALHESLAAQARVTVGSSSPLEGQTNRSPLEQAQRHYHLAEAQALGSRHEAELKTSLAALTEAFGVGVRISDDGALESRCREVHDMLGRHAREGRHRIDVQIAGVRCSSDRDVQRSTAQRTVIRKVTHQRSRQVQVVTGYRSECSTVQSAQTCRDTSTRSIDRYGNSRVEQYSQSCSAPTTTQCREVPVYGWETETYQEVEDIPEQVSYEVTHKRLSASFSFSLRVHGGESKSFSGRAEVVETETSGDAGPERRTFGPEPSGASMIRSALVDAIVGVDAFVKSQIDARIVQEVAAEAQRADGDATEALHAAHILLLDQQHPVAVRARDWLLARYGPKAPSSDLQAALAALNPPFTPEPFGSDYTFDPPKPVGYFNVAQGAGYLVSSGLSFETLAKQAALDANMSHAQLGVIAGGGDGKNGLHASAAIAQAPVLGQSNGYAFGVRYARSLRGEINSRRRLELVLSVGANAGTLRLDDSATTRALPLGSQREHFVRVPITLTASAPLYWVTVQGSVSVEPNVLQLADTKTWTVIHPASAWLGVLPLRWVLLEAGVELPFGAASLGPRWAGRFGFRL